jgi:hypothetical protein
MRRVIFGLISVLVVIRKVRGSFCMRLFVYFRVEILENLSVVKGLKMGRLQIFKGLKFLYLFFF